MALVRRFVIAFTLIATALAVAPISHADAVPARHLVNPRTGLAIGAMPMRHGSRVPGFTARRTAAPTVGPRTAPALGTTYYGGPVVSNAAVQNVLWGGSGTYLPEVAGTTSSGPDINELFAHMLTSPWAKGLSEYSTPTQTIGTGSVIDRQAITPSAGASGALIDDAAIQSELVSQVSAQGSALSAPTADTIYTLYFPEGTVVCNQSMGPDPNGDVQCSNNDFCAYHGATTATVNGVHLLYIVQPHPDAAWVEGCEAPGQTPLTALETVASHEIAETITDPQVSLVDPSAPSPQAPMGWYDTNYGEIGDVCQSFASPAAWSRDAVGFSTGDGFSFDVQQVWSQKYSACIPSPPRRVSGTQFAGGHIRLSWAAPADQVQNPAQTYDVWGFTGSTWRRYATVTATTWTTPGFPIGSRIVFQVVANSQVSGSSSREFSDMTVTVAASTPGAVPSIRKIRGGTSPIVGWTAAPGNYSAVTKYLVTGPGGTRTLGPSVRSYHWSYLRHGRYLITVRAVNRVGVGAVRKFYLVN